MRAMRLPLEILFFIITVGVLPVLINKSTEIHLDWVRRYLRQLWFGMFGFFFFYWMAKPDSLEEIVKLHHVWQGWLGYVLVGAVGIVLFCGFWWFTGRVASAPIAEKPLANPALTDKSKEEKPADRPAAPTAAEIADEIAKKFPKPQPPESSPALYIIRGKAIDLADEIMAFAKRRDSLTNVDGNRSGAPNETGQDIQDRINRIKNNSPALFEAHFSVRLKESIAELKSAGVSIVHLQEACEHVMHMTMVDCGEELKKAALKIQAPPSDSGITKIRTDAISVFNRTYADYKKFRTDNEFWDKSQAITKRDNQEMISQSFKQLAGRFEHDYGPEITRVRNELMGHIRELPPDTRNGQPYTPPLPITGAVFPQDITTRLCDLRSLLNAMEKENNMPITNLQSDKIGYAALPCW